MTEYNSVIAGGWTDAEHHFIIMETVIKIIMILHGQTLTEGRLITLNPESERP